MSIKDESTELFVVNRKTQRLSETIGFYAGLVHYQYRLHILL